MFSKKNIIKGLVLLNTGTVLAKIIGKISSAKADLRKSSIENSS